MLNALQGLLNRQGVLRFDPFGTDDGSGGDRRGRNRGNRRNDGGRNRNGETTGMEITAAETTTGMEAGMRTEAGRTARTSSSC